ncbi:hypothetical protein B484DRAFT_338817, partial [Ochromonadaceae sp. CCMP2298]
SRHLRPPPSHALTEEQIAAIVAEKDHWVLEDGFPCAHRRPRQFFVEEGLTWHKIWLRYSKRQSDGGKRVVSESRFRQYLRQKFPGLRLTRSAEDVCDACIRL